MDLAFVDNLANQNKEVKYLLVAVDGLLRFVTVQTMKTKYAKKKHSKKTENLWVDKGTASGELSKNLQEKNH